MDTKFRVWCEFEVKGEMVSCMESEASWFLLTQTGQLMEYGPMRPPHRLSGAYKKAIPLFFAGLLDKNGKEIYKGDVVSWSDGWNNYKSSIIFENGAFRESRFKNPLEEICHYWDNGKYIECEVIGNIYENPELLKKG
jgi:uncharacterized phage protein (TIGR01671 family)